jgi:tetratricopeptide (TPR) repeat protein
MKFAFIPASRLTCAAVYLFVAAAIDLAAAERWHKVSTDNFELLTTAGAGRGKEAVQYFEQVRNFFIRTSNVRPPSGKPIRIIAFSSDKQFEPYRATEGSPAYYLPGLNSDTIVMGSLTKDLFRVAIHEYVHLLVRHSKAKYPLWLNEGTADLYSTLTPVAGKVRVGEFPMGHYHALRMGKMLSLAELTGVNHDSPHYNEKDRRSIFYGQSWALTHMLNLSKEYAPNYTAFLKALFSGAPIEDAFRQTYGKGFPEVQRDLERYLRQDSYFVSIVDAKLEKRAEAPDVATPEEAEIELALADLLLGMRRKEEAATRYRELASRFPQRPEPHEALGYIEMRDRKQAAAAVHFAKAGELGSKNARMYYDWSWAAESQPDAFGIILGALRKAVELDPAFFDASYRLGTFLLRNERYGDALAALRQIKRVEPEHAARLFLAMAYCFDHLKMLDDAKASAAQSRKYATTPADISDSERFLAYLDRRSTPVTREVLTSTGGETAAPVLRRTERTPGRFEESGWEGPDPRGAVDHSTKVEGRLKMIECLGTNAKILLETADGELGLWIEDPNRVVLRGASGEIAEFACGPQPNTKVRVGYTPEPNVKRGTAGLVRLIEFQ